MDQVEPPLLTNLSNFWGLGSVRPGSGLLKDHGQWALSRAATFTQFSPTFSQLLYTLLPLEYSWLCICVQHIWLPRYILIKNCYCNFFHTSNKVIYIAHHNVYLLVPEQLKNIFAEPDSKHNTYTHLSILISSVCFQNQSCWHRHPTSSIWWWWIESRKNGGSKIKAKKLSLVPIF